MQHASLVEPSFKNHIAGMLQRCRAYKDDLVSVAVNAGLLMLFIGIAYGILSYKARNKRPSRTDAEKEKDRKDFVMRALGKSLDERSTGGPITGLPGFTSEVRFPGAR